MTWKIIKSKNQTRKVHILVHGKSSDRYFHLCADVKDFTEKDIMKNLVGFRVGSFINCNCEDCKKSPLYDVIVAKAAILRLNGVYEIKGEL